MAARLIATLALGAAFPLLLGSPALASAVPPIGPTVVEPAPIQGPVHNRGRWLVDAQGRVVILHGFNIVAKVKPYAPDQIGFGRDDAQYLQSQGYNVMRVGVIFNAMLPQHGRVDQAYLDRIRSFTQMLDGYHLMSLLDVHQDAYGPVFGGEGLPAWMTDTPALFHGNVGIEPATDTMDPGLLYAWSNLYDNASYQGHPVQTAFDDGLTVLAARFAGDANVVGYNLLNEPWAGTQWLLCIRPSGCGDFDKRQLTPFTQRAVAAVRRSDASHIAWYEPVFFFAYGSDTAIGPINDPHTGFAFHLYCPGSELFNGLTVTPCSGQEQGILARAEGVAARNGSALMNTEWGASTDVPSIQRMADEMDQQMVSWAFWGYYDCCGGPEGRNGIIVDPNQPPTAANLTQDKLEALTRPYPQAVAGTPLRYHFDHAGRKFEMAYATAPLAGESLAAGALTQVFAGQRSYPDGYQVEVRGARVTSAPCAPFVALQADPASTRVELRLSPGPCGAPRALAGAGLRPPAVPDPGWLRLGVAALGWLAAAVALALVYAAGAGVSRLLTLKPSLLLPPTRGRFGGGPAS